jgi:hypothetical protein
LPRSFSRLSRRAKQGGIGSAAIQNAQRNFGISVLQDIDIPSRQAYICPQIPQPQPTSAGDSYVRVINCVEKLEASVGESWQRLYHFVTVPYRIIK